MDRLTKEQRSELMARIKSHGSKPEMIVRSILHRLDYRFRLHQKNLSGRPDLVFAGRKKIIFVHGCFWHAHSCLRGKSAPKTNVEFWAKKIRGNKNRDKRQMDQLKREGWSCLVVWECEVSSGAWLPKALKFLDL